METDQEVMPAGAMPPEPEPEAPAPEPEKILGKFNSPDDLVTAYKELEQKIGQQGNELGSMKQMNAMLLEQMQARQAQDSTPATENEKDTFDFQAQMQALQKAVSEGDMSVDEALMRSSEISAEKATRDALQRYEEINTKKTQQAAHQKFMQENPDFTELQRTGALEPVKAALPGLHDDFSAYYALKAQQAALAAEQKQEINRIASGDQRTAKVLQSPGGPKAKNIGKPSKLLSGAELKAKTLADLEALG